MSRFLKKLRAQRGFTIVEVLVVVAIVGILAAVSFNLITSIFVTSLRSAQLATQEGNMERTFGFLGSRLAITQSGSSQIGLLNSQGNSVLSENELFFKSSYEGGLLYCYRMHYNGATRELELAQTTSAAACGELQSAVNTFAEIKNNNVPNSGDIFTYLFADGVIPTKNNDGTDIADTACQENNVTGDKIFSYQGATTGNQVTEISASMAFCPTPEPDSIVKVSPREFTQIFSIGQLCLVGSGGSGNVADNSIGPAQISNFPVEATDFGTSTISATPISGSWYKVTLPNAWGNGLWKLVPGYYNLSASTKFSWQAATGPGSREAAAMAIVKNGSLLAYSSAPEFDQLAYVSVSTGVQLTASDDISLWVRTTDVTPDRFQGGRISGTWQN